MNGHNRDALGIELGNRGHPEIQKRRDEMKRIALLLCLLLLTGCAAKENELDRAMALRQKILASELSFDAAITANYGDKIVSFATECAADKNGNLTFKVTQPESIAGITGTVSAAGGKLTFDDAALAFPLLADGLLSPAGASYVMVKSLRSGYITWAGQDGDNLRVGIDDSYADDAMHLDFWLDGEDTPIRCEILWKGRTLLAIDVTNLRFLS